MWADSSVESRNGEVLRGDPCQVNSSLADLSHPNFTKDMGVMPGACRPPTVHDKSEQSKGREGKGLPQDTRKDTGAVTRLPNEEFEAATQTANDTSSVGQAL